MNQPEIYSENNTLQEMENNHFLNKYLSSEIWKDNETILEIGMGDGKYTVETFLPSLPKNLRKYVGSDISCEMVEFAKTKYKKMIGPNIEFITLDVQGDEMPAEFLNRFDHVVSFMCFHWVTDPSRAARNVYSMLKPGGKLVAFFLEKNTLGYIFANMSKYTKWERYGHAKYIPNFFWSDDPQTEWKKTLTEAGFVNIEMFHEDRRTVFSNEEKFDNFHKGLDPVFADIPEEDKKAYSKDYLKEVRKGKLNFIELDKNTGKQIFGVNFKLLYFMASKPPSTERNE